MQIRSQPAARAGGKCRRGPMDRWWLARRRERQEFFESVSRGRWRRLAGLAADFLGAPARRARAKPASLVRWLSHLRRNRRAFCEIRHEPVSGGRAGWRPLSVENRDGVQRIFDGEGNLLAATRWGANGPEPVAEPQLANYRLLLRQPLSVPVPTPPRLTLPASKYLALVAGLQIYLYAKIQSGVAVAAFRAREFGPSNDDPYGLSFVGAIAVEEAMRFCPRYMEVQNKLTEVANALQPEFTGSPQSFGIEAHRRVAKYVNSQRKPGFKAEASFDFSGTVLKKRERGSTWLDVYEKVSEDTVCVYDRKTGKEGLSGPRYLALGNTAFRYFRGTRRFIVIELRPGW